jgi:hypothetical protein
MSGASGEGALSAIRLSGQGSIQIGSSRGGAGGLLPGTGGPRSLGNRRAGLFSSASKQTRVLTLNSQVASPERPSNDPNPRQARSRLSCSRSSASCSDPEKR